MTWADSANEFQYMSITWHQEIFITKGSDIVVVVLQKTWKILS